jgi:hypothetical protein
MLLIQDAIIDESGAPGLLVWIVVIALVVLVVAGMWRTFEKAGEPGWAALVPFYNMFVLVKIARKPLWWFFLLLVPIVNIIFWIIVYVAIARNFGKGVGFALGLFLLGPIFYPILGFGDAQYQPVAQTT